MGARSERLFVVAVTVVVMAVLMGVLSNRLEREVRNAQQMRFEFRLREIEAVIRLREAALRVRGELHLAERYVGANPMPWLQTNELGMQTQLSDYLGEQRMRDADSEPGKWIFDPVEKVLVYLPFGLDDGQFERDGLRYRVAALRSEGGQISGLTLAPEQ